MMGHESCFQLLLCLGLVQLLSSYTIEPTTEMPRDFLFAKPWDFPLYSAKNKTRFTDEEKKLIVQIHNSYRSLVLPPAAHMRELVWDDDLEQYAYNHTQLCTGKHSPGTMVKKYNAYYIRTLTAMGENLYYRHGQYYNIEEALWMFWSEGKDYDISTGDCAPGKECGHYRIMALAESGGVGCAINVCDKFTISTYPTPAVFLSCSYDGKYLIYYKPYKVGERGSGCQDDGDFENYRNGLCISPSLYYYKRGFDGNTSVVGLPSPYLTTSTVTPSTTTPTTRETSSAAQPNTTGSEVTTETTTTTHLTSQSVTTESEGTTETTATTSLTINSTASTLETTESTANVMTRREDSTSIIIISSTMPTETSESTPTASNSTQENTSVGNITTSPPTLVTLRTESSTYTSTKHTRSVNQSCRRCVALPASVFLLICLAPLMYDYRL